MWRNLVRDDGRASWSFWVSDCNFIYPGISVCPAEKKYNEEGNKKEKRKKMTSLEQLYHQFPRAIKQNRIILFDTTCWATLVGPFRPQNDLQQIHGSLLI